MKQHQGELAQIDDDSVPRTEEYNEVNSLFQKQKTKIER